MALRTKIPDFERANPLYVGAQVAFYGVDLSGNSTGVLATLYAAPTGTTTVINPQTLDSEGKFAAPVYIENPVIGEVTGANVESHTTGVIRPLRGTWRGDWVTATGYFSNDEVRHPTLDDLYVVTQDHVSGATIADDISAGKLELVFSFSEIDADAAAIAAAVTSTSNDAAAAAASASAAATAETNAETAETNAETAETNAEAAQAAAEAAAATATSASRGLNIINGYIAESNAGNAVTFAVKTLAGADPSGGDPVLFPFPTSTGQLVLRSVTAPLSITISAGSTLGASNNVPFRLWQVAFDDAGTVRLGVINCLSGTDVFPLGQYPFASASAEGGAGGADSAHTFYAASAVSNKAYAVLGYASYETGLATAGTWNASPSRLILFQAGMPLPGQTVQRRRTATGTGATGTTTIPFDNTIPQNTEGNEFLSRSITPSSAANLLSVRAQLLLAINAANFDCSSALFRDSIANALAGVLLNTTNVNLPDLHTLAHIELAGSTSATTYKVRSGGSGAGTITLNGVNGSQQFGGAFNSFLEVEEIMG